MPTRGVVVAVGPGWIDDLGTKHTLNVCVGDTILFTKHAGTTFKINGEELLVLTENEVLATIE
jgi:chaperonin GroES